MPFLFLLIALLVLFSGAFMLSPLFLLVSLVSAIYYSRKRKYVVASIVTFFVSLLFLIVMGTTAIILIFK